MRRFWTGTTAWARSLRGKLADVLLVDGRPDENLDELSRVDLVIRDGYTVVEGGKVTIPRHLVTPPRKKAQ